VRKANFDIFKILFLKFNIIKTVHSIKLIFLGINYQKLFFLFLSVNFFLALQVFILQGRKLDHAFKKWGFSILVITIFGMMLEHLNFFILFYERYSRLRPEKITEIY